MRNIGSSIRPTVLGLIAFASLAFPLGVTRHAAAQDHPQMSNVIPDGGTGAIEGKVESIDPTSRMVTIVPASGHPLSLFASPAVRIDDLESGDGVNAQ